MSGMMARIHAKGRNKLISYENRVRIIANYNKRCKYTNYIHEFEGYGDCVKIGTISDVSVAKGCADIWEDSAILPDLENHMEVVTREFIDR